MARVSAHKFVDDRQGKSSVVMVIALAVTMVPVLWAMLPPIWEIYRDFATFQGPGAQAVFALIPLGTLVIMGGWVVAVIIYN